MRTARISVVVVTAAAAVGLAAPAAFASISPNPVRPGQTVTISDDKRCDLSKGGKASSTLFGDVILSAGANNLVGTAKIPATAKPGTFRVTIECGDGQKFTETLRVIPGKGAKAGIGGSQDTNSTQLAAGAALLAAAAGAGSYLVRRRQAGNNA
jgi:hypothetical protein